jgi:hypothetical protein
VELVEDEIFNKVEKNEHLNVLELAHLNKLSWYSREMLEDAVARNIWSSWTLFSTQNQMSSISALQDCAMLRVTLRYWSDGNKQNLLSSFVMLCIVDNGE